MSHATRISIHSANGLNDLRAEYCRNGTYVIGFESGKYETGRTQIVLFVDRNHLGQVADQLHQLSEMIGEIIDAENR